MDKPLKFRVWDVRYKYWVGTGVSNFGHSEIQPWKCLSFQGEIMSNNNTGGSVDYDQKDYVIQQYTGLNDNNSKEIFEGDILKCRSLGDYGTEIRGHYFLEVKFGISESKYSEAAGYSYVPIDREIVGNIFKTPELLNNE